MKSLMHPVIAGTLLMLGLGGCAFPGTSAPAQTSPDAVFSTVGLGGTRTASVTLLPAQASGFQGQAIVHRWVENDIFQYEATLKVWNGTSFVDPQSPIAVVVPRKGTAPKTRAVFSNLKQGSRYQVSIVARGNVGGTAATTPLNSSTPAAAIFDFTAGQDVEDTISANVQVTFDQVAFNGSGTTTVLPPAEGTYQNPSAPETGVAQ